MADQQELLHPEAKDRLRDFEQRKVSYQRPVHSLGECPACDAWRLMASPRATSALTAAPNEETEASNG